MDEFAAIIAGHSETHSGMHSMIYLDSDVFWLQYDAYSSIIRAYCVFTNIIFICCKVIY